MNTGVLDGTVVLFLGKDQLPDHLGQSQLGAHISIQIVVIDKWGARDVWLCSHHAWISFEQSLSSVARLSLC